MSDIKKYYYLKLKDNFFESDQMIVLESMQDGYKYSNILMKLYLRSLKNDGKLMLNETIPFNATMLANVTRHSVGDIEIAVKIFKDLGLIDVLDNGAIYLLEIQTYIGKSSSEADRKRIYREKIHQEKTGGHLLGQMSDKYPPEKEKEKELKPEKPNFFSFSLTKSSQYENLSDVYKRNLALYANNKDSGVQLDNFLDHHGAKGTLFKNWSLAYNTWVKRSAEFNKGVKQEWSL